MILAFIETNSVPSLKSGNRAWSIVDLKNTEVLFNRVCIRMSMDEWILWDAIIAIWRLDPDPWRTSVKNKLVWLLSTSKVDCGKDLNVKKVRKVFFKESTTSWCHLFILYKEILVTECATYHQKAVLRLRQHFQLALNVNQTQELVMASCWVDLSISLLLCLVLY